MAIVVESTSSVAYTTTSSVVITKPSGLSVGDLMVVHTSTVGNGEVDTAVGWNTIVHNNGGSIADHYVAWKIADSSDVVASNFTFTMDINLSAGAMLRISGHNSTTPIQTSGASNTADTSTPSFTGITTTQSNSLLLIFTNAASGVGGGNISTYAVANSNPTWTEHYDLNTSSGSQYAISCASSTYTTAQATGNFSCAGGNSTTDWEGIIVAISPSVISGNAFFMGANF